MYSYTVFKYAEACVNFSIMILLSFKYAASGASVLQRPVGVL